jgi:AraC-like DNA-binding protein
MDREAAEHLAREIRKLPEPRSYFRGARVAPLELPQNVLLFQRSRPSLLGKEHHYHYRFVLIANLRGPGSVVLDHRSLEFRPGEAILVFPHQFHHFPEPQGDDIRWLFLTFELDRAESLAPLRNQARPLTAAGCAYLGLLVEHFLRIVRDPRPSPDPAVGLLAALALQELARRAGRPPKAAAAELPPVIDRVNRHIWDHFAEDLGLPSLAEKFAYSESHLRLLFRKRMGMSLGAYILKVRMNRARAFLVGSDRNVSEVASASGYDSLYSFSRAFKKSTGVSPLAYKKLNADKY